MKNKLLITFLIFLFLISGIYVFGKETHFKIQSPNKSETSIPDIKTTSSNTAELESIWQKGGNAVCKFTSSYQIENSVSADLSGDIYIAGTNMRINLQLTASGQSISTNYLQKDNTAYLWAGDNGTKFTLPDGKSILDQDYLTFGIISAINMSDNFGCKDIIPESLYLSIPESV